MSAIDGPKSGGRKILRGRLTKTGAEEGIKAQKKKKESAENEKKGAKDKKGAERRAGKSQRTDKKESKPIDCPLHLNEFKGFASNIHVTHHSSSSHRCRQWAQHLTFLKAMRAYASIDMLGFYN